MDRRFEAVWLDAVRQLEAADLSYGQGTEDAGQEAAWMLIHLLGLPLLESFSDFDATLELPVPAAAATALQQLVARRIASRQPAAYLLGEAWLAGVRFIADPRAIVPRSLIAELLGDGLDPWLPQPPQRIVDCCTGNASLAVLAALRWGTARVIGTEISPAALELAQANVALHGLQGRVELLRSDLLAAVPGTAAVDLLLCNPPYVNTQSMAALPAEFRAEPELALAGGEDGMDLVRRLLADAPRVLAPGGVLVLEIGHEREYFESAFPDLPAVWLPTSAGDDQVLLLPAAALAP